MLISNRLPNSEQNMSEWLLFTTQHIARNMHLIVLVTEFKIPSIYRKDNLVEISKL